MLYPTRGKLIVLPEPPIQISRLWSPDLKEPLSTATVIRQTGTELVPGQRVVINSRAGVILKEDKREFRLIAESDVAAVLE